MPAKPYVPHIGAHPHEKGITYIVQMRVPKKVGRGYTYVALSDYTLEKRTATAWLSDAQVAAGEYLRGWARDRHRASTTS
jgi:hypothetical protein